MINNIATANLPITIYDRKRDRILKGSLSLLKSEPKRPDTVLDYPLENVVQEVAPNVKNKKLKPFEVHQLRQYQKSQQIEVSLDTKVSWFVIKIILEQVWLLILNFIIQLKKLPIPLINFSKSRHTNLNISGTKKYNWSRILAISCLILAITTFIYISLPIVFAEVGSRFVKTIQVPNPVFLLNPQAVESSIATPEPTPLPTPEIIDWQDFRIYIPKIGVQSQVVANVDPSSPDEYRQVLMTDGVAHARGSYLPSESGPVFLFAHSTDTVANIARFNAKFFAARDLELGDEIYIDFNHDQYRYVIIEKKVINPSDLNVIQESEADLVLSTCYPPGTDWQRLVIFAKRVI